MELYPDEFLAWYLFFMEEDVLTCPHCEGEIRREDVDDSFDKEGLYVVCPYCNEKIREEDFD
jgi:DNA-directed RNA polymerase subunit RPC12/RpoP